MEILRLVSASTRDARSVTATRKWRRATVVTLLVLLACVVQGVLAGNASALTGIPCLQTSLETVATDALDYPPGSTVYITGTGYAPGCDATVQITRPDSVVESFTASTDLEGNLIYDYLLPPPPGVIGEYGLDILGLNGVLASMTFTDGGAKIDKIYSDAALANEDYQFAVGDTVYAKGTNLTAARGYKFEAFNAAGVSQYVGPCKTGATTASDSYAPTTPSGSINWKWVLHEWTSSTCASGPQSEDADNTLEFSVAQATAYTTSALTTSTTAFAAGATAFVVVNGLDQSRNNWSTTWVATGVSCANTNASDRPDSDANGKLPSSYLAYPPANTFADEWNKLSSYESTTCPAFASGNAGQWKVTFTMDATHTATVNVFTVDTAAPTVTINQASGQADPTTASPINFTATFSEPVTGFISSDVSFAGSTAGTGGTPTGLSATVTGGPTVYNVAVSGMATRGNVVVSIPAGSAQDAATNGNTASTSTDNSVTWDRVPATAAPTFSPPSPKTNDSLTASTTTSDPDGDNISVSWTWKVNRGGNVCTVQTSSSASAPAGVRTSILDLSQSYAPTSCTGSMINPLNPSKADVVRVEATPNDGLFDGTLQSSNITIVNTVPTVTLSGGNNVSPNEGSPYTYGYSISDADGDTIALVATSCGTGTKTNASNTNTSGSFDCTFADGPASTSVSAQATDTGFGAGAGNNATQSISVQNVAPTIAISGAANVNEGSLYTLTLGAVSDPGTDTVSDYVVHWGDGNTSHYAFNGAKTHTYADGDNNYNVTVDLTDEDGTFLDRANAESVAVDNVAPSIAISGATATSEGSLYTLTLDTVSDPGTDTVSSYVVHWGDGNSNTYGTNGVKTHTYADGPAARSITVDLVDEDGTFLDRAHAKSVAVDNVAPTIAISGAASVNEGSLYTLTLGAVTDPGTDTVTSYVVHWGDGNSDSYGTAGAKTHTYADGDANRAITVDLVDEDGTFLDRANAKSVAVDNVAPSIAISGDSNVNEGSSYSLTLGAVSDPGTDTVSSYVVHWGDGNSNTYSMAGAKTHTYADGDNTYNVTVDLTDEDGTFLDRANAKSVTVDNVAPTVTLSNLNDLSVDESGITEHTYSYSISDPGTDNVASVSTSCGADGVKVNLSDTNTNTSGSFKCTFPDGSATTSSVVSASATDDDGDTGNTDTQTVSVNNVAPTAHLSGDDEVFEGTTHTYTFTVTDPGVDSFAVNTPAYPDCGTGGDYVGGSLSTNAGGGSFDCTFPDGPATTDVKIRVTDSDGASDTDTENVVVVDVINVDPVVTLAGPSSVAEGSTHTYSYTTTDDGAPETFSRDAQSCDGGTLSADTFNPVDGSGSFDCTYADGPSAHNPSVTVSDGDGGSDSDMVAVTVTNVAPSIAISGAASVNEGSLYTLTLGAVTDPGTDTISSYVVHWGDGSSDSYGSNGAKTHTYADGPNDWEITVDLVDEDGTFLDRANDRSVHVNNVAPSIEISSAASVNEGSLYTLTLGAVTDPGTDTVSSYVVHWGDGSSDSYGSNGAKTHTYADGDNAYNVTVDLTDEDGTFLDRAHAKSVAVDNVAPSIAISGAAYVNEGSLYTLTLGAVTDPGTDTVTSYVVHWGDGNSDSYGTAGAKTHTYADGDANRAITVDLVDEDGTFLDRANAKSVAVDNVAPSIAISGAASVDEGSSYSLTLGAVSDPGTDTVTSWIVHWGDGNSNTYSSGGVKAHTYADGPNDWDITVDLVDEDGTFADAANALAVHVSNVAPTAHLSGDDEVFEGTTHTYTFTVTDPGVDSFAVNTPAYPDCGTGGDYVGGSLSTNAGGGSFDCTFPDGPATTDVKIRVTDSDGASDTDTENVVVVDVINVDPVVTLAGPSSVAEGSTHTYSYTTTDDGAPETFSRDAQSCDGGTLSADTFNPVDGSGSFDCTYADGPSTHNPTVTVSDGDGGSDSNTVAVTVTNVAPSIEISGNANVDEGSLYTLTLGAVSDPGTDTVSSYVVHWGDGSSDSYGTNGAKTHTYADGPNDWEITVDLVDEDGTYLDAANDRSVHVNNVAPSIEISGAASVNEGSSYSLTLGAVTDPGTDTVTSYVVHWGDGSSDSYGSNGAKTHTYADGDNTYNVTVDLVDEDGTYLDRANAKSVAVDNVPPTTPNLTSPADNATTGDNTPSFDWSDSTDPAGVNDTITYRIQIDNNCDFSSPERDQTTSSSDFTPVASLADGTYCWRVNASDEDGGTSAYSSVRHLTIDTAAPTVQSIDRAGDNPTNASSVDWTVTFSESVSGVDASDFALVQSGGVAGASITGVSGSGTTYTVAANTGTGNGSLGLNLNDNDSISDAGGNSLRASGGGADGSFTGQVYTIDKVGPTVTINQAVGQADPTGTAPIHFTAVFNEDVLDFGNGDLTITGTAGGTKTAAVSDTGDHRTFDVAIGGMTTSGTVIVSIYANKASDAAGNGNSASTSTDNTVTWNPSTGNAAPVVTISSPTFGQLYAKGSANVNLSASWVDADGPNPHTCTINWDDGVTQPGVVNEASRTCTKTHTFSNAGVFTINVTICDSLGACGTATVWVVVYDPSAGFVTGGGWINVAAGSYPADPTLTGRANFGFNSKYKNGGGPPTGETEFNFSVANFNFHSTNYQWLVVSNFKAQYRGTGEVNGVSGYDFRLTAYDGQINGGGGIDKFRIKITRNGQTIFDNRMGVPEDPDVADPQAIAGGSIVIHRS